MRNRHNVSVSITWLQGKVSRVTEGILPSHIMKCSSAVIRC